MSTPNEYLTMTEYSSNATVEQVADRIAAARRVLLTTHAKPDGDAMGSTLAMKRGLEAIGIEAEIYLMGPLEDRLKDIAGDTSYRMHGGQPPAGEYDLIIVLDTGSWTQLDPIAGWLRDNHESVVGIDHHAKGDDVASMRIIDTSAASTTQMLVPLLEKMGCEITPGPGGVAEAIFVGLATDSGWFRYSNADARAMALAARLLELDVDKSRLFQVIEETFRPQRLELQARALASLELLLDGAIAVMSLRPEDFKKTRGVVADISELVNTPMTVRCVRASILIASTTPKRSKLSFRSKPDVPGLECPGGVDMNLLAQHFGGGGHTHAAGASVNLDVDEVRAKLVETLAKVCPVT